MMMRMDIIRRKFPEYGDMPDDSLMECMKQLIQDITEAPEEDEAPEEVVAIGVTEALKEVKSAIDSTNSSLKKLIAEEQKPDTDLTPHFLALGVQLGKIETAIQDMCKMMDKPEPKKPEMKMCKTFKVKRDEIGGISEIVPVYEG